MERLLDEGWSMRVLVRGAPAPGLKAAAAIVRRG